MLAQGAAHLTNPNAQKTYHRGQGERAVVIQSSWPWLFGHRDDGGGLETGWHTTCLQRGVEDVCEHRRQFVNNDKRGPILTI